MEKFFRDLDRLLYLCSPYSSNDFNLKGFVFLDNISSIYEYQFGKERQLPDYKIPFYVWKRYGFHTFKSYWSYHKNVKKLLKYYDEIDDNVRKVEDNSKIWRYYTVYNPLKIDNNRKTLSEEGSITFNNTLYIRE